jgi:selenide,water dikinase
VRKRLLLIGGGHAHLFVLDALRHRRHQWQGQIDVTLVSRDLHTPYSGMLPGLIAGHYRPSECHIDLLPLAEAANVALIQAEVRQLDLVRNTARSESGEWPFDIVSIDIGSTSPLLAVPGASDYAIGVKPIDLFLQQWRRLQDQITDLGKPVHIVVAGGGAGGVEVVLAMAYRLRGSRSRVKWSLVTRDELLPGYPRRAARLMEKRLANAGVALRSGVAVSRIEQGKLYFPDGSHALFDALVWATGAAPQSWVEASGVECVDNGFISVSSSLQSTTHAHVFAAGDIATNIRHKHPKAGVYAVRQGPVLADNLLRFAFNDTLRDFRPQRDYLSLLSTGDRHAIASWYGLAWQGAWIWRWKNRIDKRFMQRFTGPFAVAAE